MTIGLSHLQENAIYNFCPHLISLLPESTHYMILGIPWPKIHYTKYTKGHPNVFCERISNRKLLSMNSLCLASEGSRLP